VLSFSQMTIPLTLYSRYEYNLHIQTINTKHFLKIGHLDTPKTGVFCANHSSNLTIW